MTVHAAAQPALRALTDLANWTPANADELGRMLQALHAYGQPCIITALLNVLEALNNNAFATPGISPANAQLISSHLNAATGIISGAACDWIDRAREATGTEWPR